MIEKGTIMESEAEPSSKELLKIYDTTLAEKLMQKLLPMIENCAKQTRSEKVVVAVSGGSGSGKTVTALLLSCFLKEKGIENYILSGDAYPHRIPKYNDAERLQIFRENAIVGMLKEQTYTEERCTIIQEFQKAGNDALPVSCLCSVSRERHHHSPPQAPFPPQKSYTHQIPS